MVIDGTGQPMFRADIGIDEEKISKIGDLHNEKGEIEIDAMGKFICPGFIDVNNHSDTFWQIFFNPNLESLIYQGITTIIGGNCGSSLAPLADAKSIESIQKWLSLNQISVNWLNLKEFFEVVEKKKLSVNFATLVGHGTIRRGILKDQTREPDAKEMEFIGKMLKDSMLDGAMGMSTGLIYTHARTATTKEIIELAKIIKKYEGVYVTHMREEMGNLIESVQEAIKIAEESKVKLHISHLKVMGEKNWHLMDEALYQISQAKEKGIDVTFDAYPYTNTGSVLYTFLPEWVSTGGRKLMLSRLKDPIIRVKVVEEMKASDFDFSKVEIAISGLNKTLARRKISEIAASQEKSIEDAIVDILIVSEGRVITSMEILSEENVQKALKHPLAIISSNGSGYDLDHAKTGEMVHPRSFGTFPKVLSKYVFGKKLLKLEEAIKKMTGLPAEKFDIEKRGKLEEKYFADITIIDKKKINDLATVDNPYQYSQGVEYVLVNGQIVLDKGSYAGKRNGEIIKH